MTGKKILDVAAGVVWRGGHFLAALRPEGKERAGFWEFPGGKREPGESMEEALARELEEELGIICGTLVPWMEVRHDYPDVRVHLHFLHVLDFRGEPRCRDGQDLLWVTPEQALGMNFLPADRQVLEALCRRDSFAHNALHA